jgi:Do/DeqQ family serine protease
LAGLFRNRLAAADAKDYIACMILNGSIFLRRWALIGAVALFLAAGSGTVPARAETRTVPQSKEQVQLSFAPVVRKVAPAVVNIYAKVVRERQVQSLFDDPFFKRFFGEGMPLGESRKRMERSLGSGVVVGADGVIVTNNHVIRNAKEVKVVLADRREFDAKILLADKQTDIAVLRIDIGKERLPTVHFGDADALEVGDIVIAIGNPFGVGQTVTSGIVSALARTNVGIADFRSFIQTDAAINPGNSGGALVSLDGRLIGINTAIFSKRGGGSVGIGFAVPSNMVRTVVNSALSGKPLVRPWLSLSGTPVTADMAEGLGLKRPTGVLVESVYPGGPAENAGLRRGDVIIKIGEHAVEDVYALRFRLASRPIGKTARLSYLRRGALNAADMKLIAPPEEPKRNQSDIGGNNPFSGMRVVNMSPAVAEELVLDSSPYGIVVIGTKRGSAASRVGFKRADVILKVNDKTITRIRDMKSLLSNESRPWVVLVRRGNKTLRIKIN